MNVVARGALAARRAIGARWAMGVRRAIGARGAIGLILLIVTAGGCAPALPQAGPADARAAQSAYPGTTEADLERGRSAYVHRCAACHRLHRPQELTAVRWPAVVAEMTTRAKLSPAEAADITRYLVVLSRARTQ